MLPTRQGSIRLFQFAGVQVYLHWAWFLIFLYGIQARRGTYSSIVWNALEYIALFAIVLMHEFGHALACRQVGGRAEQIILWPLGGVAFVAPPQRPGAVLWSIAAGPLVNVALAPIFTMLFIAASQFGWADFSPDLYHFIQSIWLMNFVLLVFNLLPIYPLDGGQILRSLLWFMFGKGPSLMVASIVGFIGVGLLLFGIVLTQVVSGGPIRSSTIWFGVMALFVLLNCWRGLMQARFLAKLAKLPRREGFACPSCHEAPLIGPLWICPRCLARFDAFQTNAFCPNCAEHLISVPCVDCGEAHSMPEWRTAGFAPAPPPLPGTSQP
jgi:Zn-dependent protease